MKIECDGCGKVVETGVINGRKRIPLGWLRLRVSGRKGGEPDATFLAEIHVCRADCAAKALDPCYQAVTVKGCG